MSQVHDPLPGPGDGSRERPVPQELNINTGTIGLVTTLARIISGLTTDKALTLFVAAAFGWLLFTMMQQSNQEKTNRDRTYEDSRERDRRHCDDREDKLAKDQAFEAERVRLFFAQQAELTRKFHVEENEKIRTAVADLTRMIGRKFPDKLPPDEDEPNATGGLPNSPRRGCTFFPWW